MSVPPPPKEDVLAPPPESDDVINDFDIEEEVIEVENRCVSRNVPGSPAVTSFHNRLHT